VLASVWCGHPVLVYNQGRISWDSVFGCFVDAAVARCSLQHVRTLTVTAPCAPVVVTLACAAAGACGVQQVTCTPHFTRVCCLLAAALSH
jgi:hypothetical protein